MSKVKIQGNASGTGTLTISAPNTDTDRSLTLPDEAGEVLVTDGTLTIDDTNDRVGIGTSSPDTKLNLGFSGADDVNTLRIEGSNGSSERFAFDIQADGGNSAVKFLVGTGGGSPSEAMRITSNRGISGGSTTSSVDAIVWSNYGSGCIDLRRYADPGNVALFRDDTVLSGTISVNGSSCSYNTSSDYRLKENVVDMTGAIDRVKALQPKRFNWIADEDDTTVDGFLAHEVSSTVPEAVNGTHNEVDDDGNPVYQGIDQSKLVPLLTGALQEAITKIETLETTVADLTTRIETLENA